MRKNMPPLIVIVLITLFSPLPVFAKSDTPKLVLQITVDGLRGDLLARYSRNFGKGGFKTLLDGGVVYRNAHYLHANTETIVGHTTLATGATPAAHGMVGNVWFDADTQELGYNIEDSLSPLIPTRDQEVVAQQQIDPSQKQARTSGRSPRSILLPTFSDTLQVSTAGKAKIFGISAKDRSAVAMAGKTGTAYWYSTDTGDYQSSKYYMDAYPDWVTQWNQELQATHLENKHWSLLLDPNQYQMGDRDDRPYETDLKGYGRTFPHPFGVAQHPLFFTRILVSAEGDRLLMDFGKKLIEAEDIGQDDVTDYLSISFSGVDAVNHFFGPGSLESEDVILQLDRTLAELFSFIDKHVGMKKTLIVLSADHGIAEMPEYATELGYQAGRLYSDEILETARAISSKIYGDKVLVKDFFRPYLYLDHRAVTASGLDREAVATAIATELEQTNGIGAAIVSGSTSSNNLKIATAAKHNHHSRRSGDIYVAPKPYWFMFDRGAIAAIHGSPWNYDTHVPIIFSGMGIKPAVVDRLVHPIDVAPTIAAMLNLSAPAGSQGSVLKEVTQP